jgi:hypothetical protein
MTCKEIKAGMRIAVVTVYELHPVEDEDRVLNGEMDACGEVIVHEGQNKMWGKQIWPIPWSEREKKKQLFCFDIFGCEGQFELLDSIANNISAMPQMSSLTPPYEHISYKEFLDKKETP